MARKVVTIQDTVNDDEEFEEYIKEHFHQLICLEVYSEFCGHCLATAFAIRKGKLEIGGDDIAMVKAPSDHIQSLSRFRNKSEPVFLFIMKGQLSRAMFGANGVALTAMMSEELQVLRSERAGGDVTRPRWEIHDMLPEEAAKLEEQQKIEKEHRDTVERLRVLTLAARKKRVNNRLSVHVIRLNFIMFWPHCHHAHYDLYEKWDNINITVAAKETLQLTEEMAREALYMSDVNLNEACLHALLSGEVLVVLFKMFDSDNRDFVQLMRRVLYEEIPVAKEDTPPEKRLPPIPAYERYASISKTAREVRRQRYEAKLEKLRLEKEERERLAAEQARMAREAEEEAIRLEKKRKEDERLARIAAGLPAEPEPEELPEPEQVEGEQAPEPEVEKTDTEVTDTTEPEPPVPEEKIEEEVFHSDVEVEGEEYIPPGGLFVPGFYTPPNKLAKANGLALFFPKHVVQLSMVLESEHLPSHVLVMFTADKRYDVMEIINTYRNEILNSGFFVGDDPYTCEHLAYTVKQYDSLMRPKKHLDRIAVMVSRKRSLPLLQLAGLNPMYISADVDCGEKECLAMFPVGYGDDYEDPEDEEELVPEKEESAAAIKTEEQDNDKGEDKGINS